MFYHVRILKHAVWVPSSAISKFSTFSQAQYALLLENCHDTALIRRTHSLILSNGFSPSSFLATKLVAAYAAYGDLNSACHVFDGIPEQTTFLWNAIIKGCVQMGFYHQALGFHKRMQKSGTIPDKFSLVLALQSCSRLALREQGQEIHVRVARLGLLQDVFAATALLDMYAKCGDLSSASAVFRRIRAKDVISWNAMIAGCVDSGYPCEAFELFRELQKQGNVDLRPNRSTVSTLLAMKDLSLQQGESIHGHVIRNGFDAGISVANALVDMYGRLGKGHLACQVFDEMRVRDVVSWSSGISACNTSGEWQKAVGLFSQMLLAGIRPNRITVLSLLTVHADTEGLQLSCCIHGFVHKLGFGSDDSVGSAVVSMYAKCRKVEVARSVFDSCPRTEKFSWNAMLSGYVLNGHYHDCLLLFTQMLELGGILHLVDVVTLSCVLSACAHIKADQATRYLHGYYIKAGFLSCISVSNSLIDAYAKCGDMDEARLVFLEMPSKDVISWNAVISGYTHNHCCHDALAEFMKMQSFGFLPNSCTTLSVLSACSDIEDIHKGREMHRFVISHGLDCDITVTTALVGMYTNCRESDSACRLVGKISVRDTVLWNAMISGCARNGDYSQALCQFAEMRSEGVKPDSATLISILPVFAKLGALHQGKWVHAYAISSGLESATSVKTSLIDMYAKNGNPESARELFDSMPSKDLVSWNAMIAAYGVNGHAQDALALFHEMKPTAGLWPDRVTFISVLSACAHAGLVQQAWQHFHSMDRDYSVTPDVEHYACMVDVFSRVGLLEEAFQFILNMPLKPSITVWGTLLFACRIHRNRELGESVGKIILALDPGNCGVHVLLASIFANANNWDEAARVREKAIEKGLKRSTGSSWIAVNEKVRAFISGAKLTSEPK